MKGDDQQLAEKIAEVAHRIPSGIIRSAAGVLERIDGPYRVEYREECLHGLVNADARQLLAGTLDQWARIRPEASARELGWALRGAAAADESRRKWREVELVWTGPKTPGAPFRRTEQALLEVIRAAEARLWLISFAGYKVPAILDALGRAAERGVDIRVVMETKEESIDKVRFSVLEGLGPRLAEYSSLWVWPLDKREKNSRDVHGTLHAKAALADDRAIFVSSANLTEFAMTLNMELGVLIRGGGEPGALARHLEGLVDSGDLVRLRMTSQS